MAHRHAANIRRGADRWMTAVKTVRTAGDAPRKVAPHPRGRRVGVAVGGRLPVRGNKTRLGVCARLPSPCAVVLVVCSRANAFFL